LAIEIANQQGGVELGGRRTPVKLVIADDRSDGAADARAVEELVRGGAAAILGTFGSTLVEYGSAAAEKLQVPYVAPTGASRALYQRGFKYLFGLQTPVEQMANATLRWVEDEQQRGKLPSPLRIALLAEKTSHGKEYAAGVKDFVEKTPRRHAAYQIVLDESFDLNVKDVRPLLERVKGARVDALLLDAHLPDYLTFLPGGYLAFPEQYGRQAQYLFLVQQNMPDGTAPVIFPRIAAVKEGVAPNPRCAQAKVAK
jgi:branched-chain amino acid transport system substrate-binding protein